ncbi:MAG TPA: hypothetical protein VGL72_17735 [Bryobacteraceae bacterium]|jgi:hypothetical protein
MKLAIFLLAAATLLAQKYTGPVPEKADLPYLVQADDLVPTEAATATEEKGKKKDEVVYVVAGAGAKARTPLAAPTFLLKVKDLTPEKLQLFRLEVRNGHREIMMSNKKGAKNPEPAHVDIKRLTDDLVRIQVSDSLTNGQYSFSPQGSDDVFCFEVY